MSDIKVTLKFQPGATHQLTVKSGTAISTIVGPYVEEWVSVVGPLDVRICNQETPEIRSTVVTDLTQRVEHNCHILVTRRAK
jgi:hypothetical protein